MTSWHKQEYNLDRDEHVLFIYDGAPAHNNPAIPGPNTEQKKLPPYSPFLNIVEQAISSLKAAIKADISCPEIQEQMNNREEARHQGITVGNIITLSCCSKLYNEIFVPSWQLNVDSGFSSCKHICHHATIVRQLRDKSFSEFDILSFKSKCYYGYNVQYHSNVSYQLSSRFSQDASGLLRDSSRFLRDKSRFS